MRRDHFGQLARRFGQDHRTDRLAGIQSPLPQAVPELRFPSRQTVELRCGQNDPHRRERHAVLPGGHASDQAVPPFDSTSAIAPESAVARPSWFAWTYSTVCVDARSAPSKLVVICEPAG